MSYLEQMNKILEVLVSPFEDMRYRDVRFLLLFSKEFRFNHVSNHGLQAVKYSAKLAPW